MLKRWMIRLFGWHFHEWGDWKDWGITYQEGKCKTCGKMKIKGK